MWDLLRFGNNIAFIDENDKKITYSELDNIGKEIVHVTGGRCLVACLCNNCIDSAVGYISFVNNSIVPLMLNANMDAELREELLQKYLPTYVWTPNSMKEEFENYDNVYSLDEYVLLKTNYTKSFELEDSLALLLTTSGSTGSPKFVRQSYKNIKSNTDSIVEYLKLTSDERPITTLPMNYTYGLSIINSHIMVGATILVTDKSLMQKEFWNFLKNYEATSFGGVPYTYEMLKRLRFMRMDLPSLKTMTQAGGKLTTELHAEFAKYAQENSKQFIVMYGQCEATARMSYLPADKALEKCGSMGIPIPGGKFRIVDVDGIDIEEPETVGELLYEGPNVTMGYAEQGEDLSLGDERKGILLTGDMAKADKDGFYYIVGRKKRFLKIYGNRVNLDEIDGMIKGKYNIEVASGGVDDHMYIFVTESDFVEAVKDFVVSKTKLNPSAFKIIVIDSIPKNDSGKTLYKELEKYYIG